MDHNSALRGNESRKAYDLVAPYYDELTGHHDYERWLASLLPALERRGLRGSRLLDLGCGTGKSTLPMLRRGWEITAVDHSPRMLAELEAKAGEGIRIVEGDVLDLPELGRFDLVLCLGDVLNYCAADGDPRAAFQGIERNLAPGGLALFDLNTLLTYRTLYSGDHSMVVGEDEVAWLGRADGRATPGGIFESVHEVRAPDGSVTASPHRQRHLDEREVREALAGAGLECLDVFGQGFDAVLQTPLEEELHTKSIFIARPCPRNEERR